MAVEFSEERLGLILGLLKGRRHQVVLGEKDYIQNKITCRNNSVLAQDGLTYLINLKQNK